MTHSQHFQVVGRLPFAHKSLVDLVFMPGRFSVAHRFYTDRTHVLELPGRFSFAHRLYTVRTHVLELPGRFSFAHRPSTDRSQCFRGARAFILCP